MAVAALSTQIKTVTGGVTAARGFTTAGVRCGIKRKRRDVALLRADGPAVATAGMFTTNVVRAPCVSRNEQILGRGGNAENIRAIVVNAGNANAGNGRQGEQDNTAMATAAAHALNLRPEQILTASTGIIGTPLPMNILLPGIGHCAAEMSTSADAAAHAAEAILTTDLFVKEIAVEFECAGKVARIGGMAKGSGMIAPNMATMLAFLTTDLAVTPDLLDAALRRAVDVSFHCLTVDGDTSTNDSCFLMASGAAGNPVLTHASADFEQFVLALQKVCIYLAKEVARDGEGATKLVTIAVSGAHRDADAKRVAKTIAESPLVKTALFGNDPNWGRILAAAGRAGVNFDPENAVATLAGVTIFENGQPAVFDAAALSQKMAVKEITITLDLGTGGEGAATFYTCDFSYDYVRINAEYHT